MLAYNFADNHVPGVADYEEQSYWRDVGNIDAYYAAHYDVLSAKPRFNLFNPKWFINSSSYQGPSPMITGEVSNSTIAAGSRVSGARIKNSMLRREVIVEEDVEIEDCLIMDYTVIRRGSRLKRVIVDRYNVIEPNSRIGFDAAADRARYTVSDGGIVVLAKGEDIAGVTRYQI